MFDTFLKFLSGCFDYFRECKQWRREGLCVTQFDILIFSCCKSCQFAEYKGQDINIGKDYDSGWHTVLVVTFNPEKYFENTLKVVFSLKNGVWFFFHADEFSWTYHSKELRQKQTAFSSLLSASDQRAGSSHTLSTKVPYRKLGSISHWFNYFFPAITMLGFEPDVSQVRFRFKTKFCVIFFVRS